MKDQIKILIVDDSETSIAALKAILEMDPRMKVIGIAHHGEEALKLTQQLKPDIITMDIFMPTMNGVAATHAIMNTCPTPILVISSPENTRESQFVFDALQAGALSIIEKPQGFLNEEYQKVSAHILESIRTLAHIPVVSPSKRSVEIINTALTKPDVKAKILALGASTGGPAALRSIISRLPAHFSIPIVITQHIRAGFLEGLLNWLKLSTPLTLKIAEDHQKLVAGYIYFAPDKKHLRVEKGETPVAILDDGPPMDHFKPAINALFSSVATSYPGAAIGGILTGMGKDGAAGLLQMKTSGCVTFAQSEASAIIYGMPKSAVLQNAVNYIFDLEEIVQFLMRF